MDVTEVLTALRIERDQVITVIENLERLAVSREHRRGRPSMILPAPKKRGRPKGSKNKTAVVRPQKALASTASASGISIPI